MFDYKQVYTMYKGIFYSFYEDDNYPMWVLFDDYMCGTIMQFNAIHYRIDECFDCFFKVTNRIIN